MQIYPTYLIISMFVTAIILYLISPKPTVVFVKPNINDKISRLYKDNNNVCYRYRRKQIPC
jgi:hypothetical protein